MRANPADSRTRRRGVLGPGPIDFAALPATTAPHYCPALGGASSKPPPTEHSAYHEAERPYPGGHQASTKQPARPSADASTTRPEQVTTGCHTHPSDCVPSDG